MSHRSDKRGPMRASPVDTSLRALTWGCVILLAILSLLPDQQMVRTGLPGRVEHFVAYAGSAAIAVAGYGDPKWHADHWRLLGVRRRTRIPPALLARKAPSDRGLCGVSTGGVVRRSCYSLSSAPAVRLPTLKVISRAVDLSPLSAVPASAAPQPSPAPVYAPTYVPQRGGPASAAAAFRSAFTSDNIHGVGQAVHRLGRQTPRTLPAVPTSAVARRPGPSNASLVR